MSGCPISAHLRRWESKILHWRWRIGNRLHPHHRARRNIQIVPGGARKVQSNLVADNLAPHAVQLEAVRERDVLEGTSHRRACRKYRDRQQPAAPKLCRNRQQEKPTTLTWTHQ